MLVSYSISSDGLVGEKIGERNFRFCVWWCLCSQRRKFHLGWTWQSLVKFTSFLGVGFNLIMGIGNGVFLFEPIGADFLDGVLFRWSQREDHCMITLRRFRRMWVTIWGGFWWIGWWRLQRNTSSCLTLCIWPFLTLIDSYLQKLSTGRGSSYWVFLQCSLLRKHPSPWCSSFFC